MKASADRILLAICIVATCARASAAEELSFERDVRPILKAHCFHCHGEDGLMEGSLDLRLRRLMVEGGDSGAAIVPGDAESSYLLERLDSGEMPPDDKIVPDHEIAIIREWIELGAVVEFDEPESLDEGEFYTPLERAFWSFQPIERPPVPIVEGFDPGETPVDQFIARRLAENDLSTSPVASRSVLIRRLYFDLLGLPPPPEEVESFANDPAPDAYVQLVERLLASPAYGERWGRHWLDVAGYADSEGYVDSDPVREFSYFYRDYVVRAFNDDMPFDEFIVEQLAGDELVARPYDNLTAEETQRLTATGYLRMAPDGTGAGGVDQNVARNEVVSDTINIVGTSLLGLTIGCARCHNHRYDPISQSDYYEFRAIFEPALDWRAWKPPNSRRVSLYQEADRDLAAEINVQVEQAVTARAECQQAHIDRTLEEELIKAPEDLQAALRIAYTTAASERTDEQVALLKQFPNIQNITTGSLYLYSQQRGRRANEIQAVADRKQSEFIDHIRSEAMNQLSADQRAMAEQALATLAEERTSEQLELLNSHPALLVSAETLSQFDPEGAALIGDITNAAETCRNTDSNKELEDLQNEINAIRATIPKEYFLRALTEPVGHEPETHVFFRGNHTQPRESVLPSDLDILADVVDVAIPSNDPVVPTTGRRLAYARQLTNGEHPLVARVFVNRIWLHHFGRGLVSTPGDFGYLGERPSHPELLDWLASEFVDSGWQVKHIHRIILLSRTYQQSSQRSGSSEMTDPDNRWLSRQTMRRLEAEAIRDAIISVSGNQVDSMFGPPVPVMEDAVGQIVIGREDLDGERKPRDASSLGGDEHRRSIYVQVRRSRPLAALETFDLAFLTPNCTERASSNVAPQSLFLMNSDMMVTYADAFADRVVARVGEDPIRQATEAWRLAYGYSPSEETLSRLVEFLAESNELASTDEEQEIRSALAILCQSLLASNRFLYVD